MSLPVENKRVMMEIEIKFGKGRSDRVQVHFDDDPAALADDFVKRHKLKESSIPVITQYITTTMENFLSQPRNARKSKDQTATKSAQDLQPPTGGEAAASVAPTTQDGGLPPMPLAPRASEKSTSSAYRSPQPPAAAVPSGLKDESLLDETDLLSRITHSLSMSIDHKQYQENVVDKRMSLKNFSLKDIEAEIASAAVEAERTPSVDSDMSTVQVQQPVASTMYDHSMSLERNERSERDSRDSRRSPINGIGFQPFQSSTSSARSTLQRSFTPPPESSEVPPRRNSVNSHTPVEYDDTHMYHAPSGSINPGEVSPASRHTNIGFSNNDYDDDGDLSTSEHEDENPADAPAYSAEEMYNRLKQGSTQTAVELAYSAGYGGGGAGKVLKPSGSSMQLGLRKSSLSNGPTGSKNDKSLVGKSANERLYNAAQMDRDKHARRARIAADSEMKALVDGKFKLNKNSKKIVSNLRPKNYNYVHIGDRLYEEGLVEKQLKDKRSEELKDKLTPEEWSCAKCGTFQKIFKTSIVIQPLHQMQNKARILNNTGDSPEGKVPANELQVCKECGWNQGIVPTHKPVNIALTLSDEPEDMLRSRWQGGNGAAPEQGGIHQYLYENARTRENIQQLNRVLWNEAHSGLTFAPVIPESSVEILEKYKPALAPGGSAKTQSSGGVDTDNSVYTFSESDLPPPPPPLSLGQSRDGKNILAGPAIGAYLSKSATERLSATHTRPVADIAAHHRRQMEGSSQASTANHVDQGQFVNRLVYEYKDKQKRLQKATEFHSKHDIYTGERLFQPKVGPDPEEALGLGVTRDKATSKRNVFEDIMLKDKQLMMRRKEAEDKAVVNLMKDLNANQVKALDSSHQILKQSTENNIEELFQVLLEAQQQIIQDGNAAPAEPTSGASSPVPEWKALLLDLDQINTDMMIPEVGLLLNEIRAYKLSQQHAQRPNKVKSTAPAKPAPTTEPITDPQSGEARPSDDVSEDPAVQNMLVSFASFRKLMLECMKRRDGTGRSYVYVPKKKPDVTIQMIQNKLKEETFRPTIDKNSAALCMRRHKELSDYPIEDVLREEGERIRSKWESARQERILQDSKELTFKPKLFRPPSYVKPKYWGMEETVTQDSDSDGGAENRDHDNSPGSHNEDHFHQDEFEAGALEARHLDESSIISSDEEAQVVQMPPLQARSSMPSTTQAVISQSQPAGPPPLPAAGNLVPSRKAEQGRSSREISPVRRKRDISPSTQVTDDQSINTISTKFTTDEQPRNSVMYHNCSTRSLGSGAPLVTRRNPTSTAKSYVPSSSVNAQASSSGAGGKKLVSSVVKSGRLGTPGRGSVAPPPLPHELLKQK